MALTNEQKTILEKALHGDNLFITGGGGVGKSFIVNYIVEALEKRGKAVLVTASTGKAATLIGGVTCHRACRIPIKMAWLAKPKISKKDPLYEADVLLIDEVSMLRIDAFDYIAKTIEEINELRQSDEYRSDPDNTHWNPIQMIVVGDFFQLPPVIISKKDEPDDGKLMSEHYGFDVGQGFAFLAPGWKRSNFVMCELTKVMRQADKPMIDALNAIRFGDRGGLAYFKKHARQSKPSAADIVYLCGTNRAADDINNTALASLPGSARKYYAICNGQVTDQDKQAPDLIKLKIGAQVIMLQNTENYRNGSSGIVVSMRDDSVSVQICETGEEIDVPYATWDVEKYDIKENEDGKKEIVKIKIGSYSQLPLRLGYALTIHKSQGQTFDKVAVILGSTHSTIFACGQLYVALSRARSMDGLYIQGNIDLVEKLADPEVLRFYKEQKKERIAEKKEEIKTKTPKKEKCRRIAKPKEKATDNSKFVTLHCSKNSAGIAKVFVESLSDEATISESGTEIRIPVKYKTQAEAFINALP